MPTARAIESSDRDSIRRFLLRRWGSATIMLDGRAIDAAALPGFIAYGEAATHDTEQRENGANTNEPTSSRAIVGLATLLDDAEQSEIVTLDATVPRSGLGTVLVELAAQRARALGLRQLLTRTTNDNLDALRFYQRRGFRLHRLVAGAIDLERTADPAIPLLGRHGIPLRDEISLLRSLYRE
ncbi:MAG: GNAT family N-acetyltransferase [Lysobacter sp.]